MHAEGARLQATLNTVGMALGADWGHAALTDPLRWVATVGASVGEAGALLAADADDGDYARAVFEVAVIAMRAAAFVDRERGADLGLASEELMDVLEDIARQLAEALGLEEPPARCHARLQCEAGRAAEAVLFTELAKAGDADAEHAVRDQDEFIADPAETWAGTALVEVAAHAVVTVATLARGFGLDADG